MVRPSDCGSEDVGSIPIRPRAHLVSLWMRRSAFWQQNAIKSRCRVDYKSKVELSIARAMLLLNYAYTGSIPP